MLSRLRTFTKHFLQNRLKKTARHMYRAAKMKQRQKKLMINLYGYGKTTINLMWEWMGEEWYVSCCCVSVV